MKSNPSADAKRTSVTPSVSNVESSITTELASAPTSNKQLRGVLGNPETPLSPAHIMQLQIRMGNRAVAQLLKSRTQTASTAQLAAKFPVSQSTSPIQLYKARMPGGEFESISDMSHLDTLHAQTRDRAGVHGGMNYRGETYDEYNAGTINDVSNELSARGAASQPNNASARAAAQQYSATLKKAFDLLELHAEYTRITDHAVRTEIDNLIIANGSDWGTITATVQHMINARIPEAREFIEDAVMNNYEVNDDMMDRLNIINTELNGLYLLLHTIPNREDHSPNAKIKSATGAAEPGYNPMDRSGAAVLAELVDMNGIAIPDNHFEAALIAAATDGPNGMGGPLAANDIAVPNKLLAKPLVGLFHQTRAGAGGYKGRSIWGTYGNKLSVHALAQHGGTNKEYVKVAGPGTIPAQWRLV